MAAAIGAMFSITLGASLAKSLFPLIGPAGTTVLRLGIAAVMLAWYRRCDAGAGISGLADPSGSGAVYERHG